MTEAVIDIPNELDISDQPQDSSDPMQNSDGDDTSLPVQIDINNELNTPSQQQDPLHPMQNNNGDNTSPPSTGEGAPENEQLGFVKIKWLLAMMATAMGVLAGLIMSMLVKKGILYTLPRMDFWSVIIIFLTLWFRYWPYLPHQATSFMNGASPNLFLSANNNWRIANNMQQLAVPIHFISRCKIIFVMISSVLSMMRLYSQDFGQKKEANKINRDSDLNFFYVVALTEALLILAEEALGKWKVKRM